MDVGLLSVSLSLSLISHENSVWWWTLIGQEPTLRDNTSIGFLYFGAQELGSHLVADMVSFAARW